MLWFDGSDGETEEAGVWEGDGVWEVGGEEWVGRYEDCVWLAFVFVSVFSFLSLDQNA